MVVELSGEELVEFFETVLSHLNERQRRVVAGRRPRRRADRVASGPVVERPRWVCRRRQGGLGGPASRVTSPPGGRGLESRRSRSRILRK